MKLDQTAHGVHVLLECEAELVFGVALFLKREDHVFHSRAAAAHTAEALPQSQCHAPEGILYIRFTLRVVSSGIVQQRQTDVVQSLNLTRVVVETLKCPATNVS